MRSPTLEKARAIEKRYGSNYYLATLFFPKEKRDAVFILYAFVRIPDEFVDNPVPGTDPHKKLAAWRAEWIETYTTGQGTNDIMLHTRELFLTYAIPFSLSLEFIDAMMRDLTQSRYETYQELKSYMRGSAEVVGVMLTHILGYSDEKAFFYAETLGEAMQLTNFIRDIYEDLIDRDRIYLPKEDLTTFQVTEDILRSQSMCQELRDLVAFETKRAHELFRIAETGFIYLPQKSRRAVVLAALFYEGILEAMRKNDYNIFKKQQKLSPLKKLSIILRTYVR